MRFRPWLVAPALAGLVLVAPLAHAAPAAGARATKAAPVKTATTATKATPAPPATAAATTPAAAATPAKAAPAKAAPAKAPLVDLNSAPNEELVKLPGIGEAIAAKIVAGRPFKAKSELLSRGLVNKAQYGKLAPYVIAKQSAPAPAKAR
jgi:competence protein ComEA